MSGADTQEKLLQLILAGIAREDGGVHVETALTLLGALTGFATQMAVREKLITSGKNTEEQVFKTVTTENGTRYYTGDVLLDPLFSIQDGRTSLFKVCASIASQMGAGRFPDVEKLASHVAETLGNDDFGLPRLPQEHMPQHLPFTMLRDSWDTIETFLRAHDDGEPLNWPFMLTGAAGRLAHKTKNVIDPHIITPLAVEAALPMAYIDPALVRGKATHDGEKTVDLSRSELGKLLQSDAYKSALRTAKSAQQ